MLLLINDPGDGASILMLKKRPMQTTIQISATPACELDYRCPICGCSQYIIDPVNYGEPGDSYDKPNDHQDSAILPHPDLLHSSGIALHCASAAAKFWQFPRRSPQELVAKWHWDQSQIIRP